MSKPKLQKKIKLPLFTKIKGDSPGETIINLYQKVIPEKSSKQAVINPKKIKLNYDDCLNYIKKDQKQFPDDKKQVGLMWMNQGPAADKDIPPGEVYLYTGYLTEDK